MLATLHIPTDASLQGFSPKAIVARILAAALAAEARARTRRDYQRMMGSDAILRDVGIRREDVRRAMEMDPS